MPLGFWRWTFGIVLLAFDFLRWAFGLVFCARFGVGCLALGFCVVCLAFGLWRCAFGFGLFALAFGDGLLALGLGVWGFWRWSFGIGLFTFEISEFGFLALVFRFWYFCVGLLSLALFCLRWTAALGFVCWAFEGRWAFGFGCVGQRGRRQRRY